jgi:hypothetical protein
MIGPPASQPDYPLDQASCQIDREAADVSSASLHEIDLPPQYGPGILFPWGPASRFYLSKITELRVRLGMSFSIRGHCARARLRTRGGNPLENGLGSLDPDQFRLCKRTKFGALKWASIGGSSERKFNPAVLARSEKKKCKKS